MEDQAAGRKPVQVTTPSGSPQVFERVLFQASEYGSLGILLVLLVLQVCVSVTVCVFSARAIRRHGRTRTVLVG